MRCGKHKHQPGQKFAATNQKSKSCGKIGHFAKVCMTARRKQGGNKMVANVQLNEGERDTNKNYNEHPRKSSISGHQGISHQNNCTEWTSSIMCTCSQATQIDTEARRIGCHEQCPYTAKWQDFCDKNPID